MKKAILPALVCICGFAVSAETLCTSGADPLCAGVSAGTLVVLPIRIGSQVRAVVNDGVCTVYGTGDMTDLNQSDVNPFENYMDEITDLVVESGVTGIGNYGFYEFRAVTNVIVASSVTNVGDYAFYDCCSLKSITFEGATLNFGSQALQFTAAIFMNDSVPVIYTIPEVMSASYVVWAKTNLTDKAWIDVTGKTDAERSAYHFFKVEL